MNIKKSFKRYKKKKYVRMTKNEVPVVKRRTVAGPWKNVAEFKTVCNWLYGPDANVSTRQNALDRMRIWNVRRSTLCPAAVLATIALLDAQLKDETNEANLCAEDLRKLYAYAFMRFFNFMSSIMQLMNNIRSMYEIAKELGLPSFVVDIRHACAHGQLIPPLMVLRNASKYCMQWLYEYYWQYQQINMRDVDASQLCHKEKTELDEKMNELITIFDTALEVYMKGADTINMAKRQIHGKRFQNLKAYYMAKECNSMTVIFDHIAQELNTLLNSRTNYYNKIKDLSETCIEAILKINYFFNLPELKLMEEEDFSESQVKGQHCKKHERLLAVTQSFYRMLALNDLLVDLLEALLDIAENSAADRNRKLGAGFWSWHIIKAFIAFRKCKWLYKVELDKNPSQEEFDMCNENNDRRKCLMNITEVTDRLRELLVFCGIDRKTTLILSVTIHRPWVWRFEHQYVEKHLQNINAYTKPAMKSLLELMEPQLNDTELKRILKLIEAYLPGNIASKNKLGANDLKNSTTTKIYNVQDVLNELNATKQAMNSNGKIVQQLAAGDGKESLNGKKDGEELRTSYGIWSFVEDDPLLNWKSCPLGKLPWE